MNCAEIVSIGSELLLPGSRESNSFLISKVLFSLGIPVQYKSVVGDSKEDIICAVQTALDRVRWVILTGGLGPTIDDVTREAVASALRKPLVLNREILKRLKEKFRLRGRNLLPIHERQAWFPRTGIVIPNKQGIADGFILKSGQGFLISLPGVPAEMGPMMESTVCSFISRETGKKAPLLYKKYKTFGISESGLNELLKDLGEIEEVELGFLAKGTGAEVSFLIKDHRGARAQERLKNLDRVVRSRLKGLIYGEGDQTLEGVVGNALKKGKKTVSVAESCTGGLVSHRLTNIPGSSAYFNYSAVTYSNQAKVDQLGVSPLLIRKYGAVSPNVALAMAEGVRRKGKSDLGVAVTGIAGPGGGTARKPVGLVYFGLADRKGSYWEEARYNVDRETFKWFASSKALDMVRNRLLASKHDVRRD